MDISMRITDEYLCIFDPYAYGLQGWGSVNMHVAHILPGIWKLYHNGYEFTLETHGSQDRKAPIENINVISGFLLVMGENAIKHWKAKVDPLPTNRDIFAVIQKMSLSDEVLVIQVAPGKYDITEIYTGDKVTEMYFHREELLDHSMEMIRKKLSILDRAYSTDKAVELALIKIDSILDSYIRNTLISSAIHKDPIVINKNYKVQREIFKANMPITSTFETVE